MVQGSFARKLAIGSQQMFQDDFRKVFLRGGASMARVDLVAGTERYKAALHEFYLDVNGWRSFKTRYKLDWQRMPFEDASQAMIPKEPGIYAFTLEVTAAKLPSHGYIMYVGKAGDRSNNTLYKRFAQYRRHLKNEDGRPKVLYMLSKWKGDLMFNFVPFDPAKPMDLGRLEVALINAVRPPVNIKDYEADISSHIRAAF
jgi:hypothetical protein